MADSAGELTFTFGADFSGFTRAADGAGRTLDDLGRAAARWADGAASAAQGRLGAPLQLTGAMDRAAQALRTPPKPATGTDGDDQTQKELSHLADQLALLQSTGAAHDAIAERIKTETEQAKLGTDATVAQKAAVASLVGQIDAAKAAQTALKAEQEATNEAWSFGADTIERGLSAVILQGGRLQDVVRSLLSSVARQGLSAALTGSGPLAGLFGTAGTNGATGGLFGALQGLFTGGLSSAAKPPDFSGLYATGGTIGAGRWGIAGEAGPEVVAGPATVVPWSKVVARAGSAAPPPQTINFNVTTPDAPSFARSETQVAALLARAAGRGQRNQ